MGDLVISGVDGVGGGGYRLKGSCLEGEVIWGLRCAILEGMFVGWAKLLTLGVVLFLDFCWFCGVDFGNEGRNWIFYMH